jgi:hypothetical protein
VPRRSAAASLDDSAFSVLGVIWMRPTGSDRRLVTDAGKSDFYAIALWRFGFFAAAACRCRRGGYKCGKQNREP